MYSPAAISVADNYLSNYFDGMFFSGAMPTPTIPIAGVPYAAIIDLQTGEMVLGDITAQVNPDTFLLYAQMLNED